MIPKISNDHIQRVSRCMETFRDAYYARAASAPLLDALGAEEIWLLSFIDYLLFSCRLFRKFEGSPYYPVPTAKEQRSSFDDFLGLLRFYRRKRITPKNERRLIVFLTGCTPQYRDFYFGLLTHQAEWIRFMKKMRDYGDPSLIHPEDIFGGGESTTRTPFGELAYPLMVTTVPARGLPTGIIQRDGGRIVTYRFQAGKKVRLKEWMKFDAKFITAHSFLMVGLIDEANDRFYPLDYYEDVRQYRDQVRKGRGAPPYRLRLGRLEEFLSHNFLRKVQKVPKEYLSSDADVEGAVRRVLVGSPHTTLFFLDGAGKSHTLEAIPVKGIIGEIWEEERVARGFTVWHNTYPVRCSYDFSGTHNALLFRPEVLVGRVVTLWLFVFDTFRSGSVKEILFEERPFCSAEIDLPNGISGRIEKCAYCAKDGTQVAHKYRGICVNTNCNWQSLFGRYGPDRWIVPGKTLAERRAATGWDPVMLNNVGFTYKGYRIVCREEDGALMFRSDPQTMKNYLYLLSDDTNWANSMQGRIKFVTAEDMRQRHLSIYPPKEQANEVDAATVSDPAEKDQGGQENLARAQLVQERAVL